MKFKDFIFPITLALITTWAIQYFFFGGSNSAEQTQSGQSFTAPKTRKELKPRNTEVDFVDVPRTKDALKTSVETKGARLTFSSDGAFLEKLEFKQISSGAGSLATIEPVSDTERETRALLLAFEQKTPFFYDLISRNETEDKIELVYQAPWEDGVVKKKFDIYKNTYKIDLDITIEGQKAQASVNDLRVFWPSPLVPTLGSTDVISALSSDEKGSVIKTAQTSLDIEQGRFSPTLFGTDDRYFVHAMIEDSNAFVERAYYKAGEKGVLISIIEGPTKDVAKEGAQASSWKLSFYFGPKEGTIMAAVDPRLEQTLEYSGWLSPISKFLLYILKLLYSFFKNFGWAIIALTVLVKLILLPFTYHAEESMKKRAEFDKKLRYIQAKYKDNPDMLARERAELVQKHGMPGLSGCLPLLLQLPIFVSLSRVLSSSIELYRAPFAWIPDLSARDPYYILPILTAAGMAAQALLTPGSDPKQRISTLIMALVVGAVTTSLAAGLSLYICMFTLLGVIQAPIMRMLKRS
jgi:YidC/Oxa1 family membrane protein insertase